MRLFVLLAAVATAVAGLQQQKVARSLLQNLPPLPLCGVLCLRPVMADLPCNISTVESLGSCLCPNQDSLKSLSNCVVKTCSYTDQIAVRRSNIAVCEDYPIPSRSREVQMVAAVMFCIAGICVLLRCYSRIVIAKQFWYDDWCIIVTSVFLTVVMGIILFYTTIGFGKHIWNVDPDQTQLLLRLIWVLMLIYIIVQVLTKVSILLFYLRVFPQRWMRITVWTFVIWLLVHGIGFFLAVAFECTPVALIWNKNLEGTCINQNAIVMAGAVFSIVEDLVIFILPMPLVTELNIGRGRRIILVVMFGLGSFACVASMIRVKVIVTFGLTLDSTWDNVDLTIWSIIELGTAVICVCLPSTKPLLNRYVPRFFSSRSSNANSTAKNTSVWSVRNRGKMQNIPDEPVLSVSAEVPENRRPSRVGQGSAAISLESGAGYGRKRPWPESGSEAELMVLENGKVVALEKNRPTIPN